MALLLRFCQMEKGREFGRGGVWEGRSQMGAGSRGVFAVYGELVEAGESQDFGGRVCLQQRHRPAPSTHAPSSGVVWFPYVSTCAPTFSMLSPNWKSVRSQQGCQKLSLVPRETNIRDHLYPQLTPLESSLCPCRTGCACIPAKMGHGSRPISPSVHAQGPRVETSLAGAKPGGTSAAQLGALTVVAYFILGP